MEKILPIHQQTPPKRPRDGALQKTARMFDSATGVYYIGAVLKPYLITLFGGDSMWEVEVDKDKCNGDEECVNACPAQVFEMVDGKSEPVNVDECLGCETCIEVCPEEAITVTEM